MPFGDKNHRTVLVTARREIDSSHKVENNIFYQAVEKGSVDDTEINRIRCYHMVSLLINSKIYHNCFGGLGAKNEAEVATLRVQMFGELLAIYNSFDSMQTQLVPPKFSPVFVWVFGFERMLGMGRSQKSNQINELKCILQDCTEVNIRYFIFTRTMEETGELRDAFGYYLMCDVSSQDQSRLKRNILATTYGKTSGVSDEECAFIKAFGEYLDSCPRYAEFKKRILDHLQLGLPLVLDSYFGGRNFVVSLKQTQDGTIDTALNSPIQGGTS